MNDEDLPPQLYLITPPEFALPEFGDTLGAVLDTVEIACLRLAMSTTDEGQIARAADGLRDIAHARDIPVLIEDHFRLVIPHGLDGVHLTDHGKSIHYVRRETDDADMMIGAYCGASRHAGMTAGESGADYIAMGPMGATGLGTAQPAAFEDFEWWSQMIEIPIIAEGALDVQGVEKLAPVTDFFAIGPEIWGHDDPKQALLDLTAALR